MLRWLARLGRRGPAPLTGAPLVRRQKTHSAESGYVYQYYYEGYRVTVQDGVTGTEYVFAVSADRTYTFPVPVFVADEVTAAWERAHQRDLNSTERYAIAKMALFRAFDERDHPRGLRDGVLVTPDTVEAVLDQLGIE